MRNAIEYKSSWPYVHYLQKALGKRKFEILVAYNEGEPIDQIARSYGVTPGRIQSLIYQIRYFVARFNTKNWCEQEYSTLSGRAQTVLCETVFSNVREINYDYKDHIKIAIKDGTLHPRKTRHLGWKTYKELCIHVGAQYKRNETKPKLCPHCGKAI